MNRLAGLFGNAIIAFLLIFCVIVLLQRNKTTFAKWTEPSERYDQEAENVSRNLDKGVKSISKIYSKAREEAVNEGLISGGGGGGSPRRSSASTANKGTTEAEPDIPAPTPRTYSRPTAEVRRVAAAPSAAPAVAAAVPATTTVAYTPPATPSSAMSVKVSPNGMYQVQLGIYKVPPDYGVLRQLGAIYIEKMGDGKQRIYLGNYATRSDADRIVTEVRRLGFKDAFVKTIDNTTILPPPAAAAPSATVARKGTNAPPLVTPNCCPQTASAAPANGNVYVIQLGASQFPVLGNARKLTAYGSVYKDHDARRDLTKIMLGTFATAATAEQALQAAKAVGFSKAFIKTLPASTVSGWAKVL